jgi:hypothetical protein
MSYKQMAVICRSACSAPNMSRADLRSLNVREASLLRGFGLLLALTGELSWLSIVVPKAGLLIPLARWPGFIWLIATGFLITREKVVAR